MHDKLTAALRAGTAEQHSHIEELLYSGHIFKGTLTVAQYVHLMQVHHQFHVALENALASHKEVRSYLPVQARPKSELARLDLQALGEEPLLADQDLFASFNDLELLGAVYVSEGSMLGGAVIARNLKDMPGVRADQDHLHFFTAYGKDLGPNWTRFCEQLNTRPQDQWPAIVEGAQRAFKIYGELFEIAKKCLFRAS